MKLKNFLKKEKREKIRETKTFNTNLKPQKKQTRADGKAKERSKKRTFFLIIFAVLIFTLACTLFAVAFIYNNYIFKKINSSEILTPGKLTVIEFNDAKNILAKNDIDIQDFGYVSGSAQLSLKIEDGPTVYFSESVEFLDQVEILKSILYTLKNEGKNARFIDLRYNRPIVKF